MGRAGRTNERTPDKIQEGGEGERAGGRAGVHTDKYEHTGSEI